MRKNKMEYLVLWRKYFIRTYVLTREAFVKKDCP